MAACEGCATRRGLYLRDCPQCEARHIARLRKHDRLATYLRALERGEDVDTLKARVLAEWKLDQKEKQ